MISLVLISFFIFFALIFSTVGNKKTCLVALFFNSGEPFAAIAIRNDFL
ncbi:hypothetical protein D083_1704 [Dickeya solani RNS 08.23.3.1.A]|nr:hypothetical protein D083_1704 [Dickeya solani RNS 08.23.3.1.A]